MGDIAQRFQPLAHSVDVDTHLFGGAGDVELAVEETQKRLFQQCPLTGIACIDLHYHALHERLQISTLGQQGHHDVMGLSCILKALNVGLQ